MTDFGNEQCKARAKLSRKTCTAWRKFNAGKIDYTAAVVIIIEAETECEQTVEAAYVASDTRH